MGGKGGGEVSGFPFSAVVGMEELRLGLVLNAVSPGIGGVLVRGEKGTAKSTMVRALAAILPDVQVVAGCRFSCDPAAPDPSCPDGPHETEAPSVTRTARLVELPVGASEDRLVGALDIERALTEGVKAYEPGLLAAAHRGVLYVDEVNLLHDHLVDLLLDAAALGTCYVERDGVSVRHAARFLLVGTMNPEEGELRPQLLDRFGLTVKAAAPRDPALRGEVVRRRLAYDAGPARFAAAWHAAESALASRIVAAQALLPGVVLPDATLRQVASVCAAFDVDGLRADLVTARAAIAHAAWEGRSEVTAVDVRAAARLALPHRRRRQPFDAPQLDESELDRALAGAGEDPDDDPGPGDDGPGGGEPETTPGRDAPPRRESASPQRGSAQDPAPQDPGQPGPGSASARPPASPGPVFRVKRIEVPGVGAGVSGRRSRARTDSGHITGALRPRDRVARVHVPATFAAAAPYQVARGRAAGGGLLLRPGDLREARHEGRESNLVLFAVDASGSMAARARMGAVKGAVLSLLLDAYQRRDKVGMVTFRGSGAEVALPPTFSVEAAAARLAAVPTGGRTPLAAGLLRAGELLRTERIRDPRRRALLVLVTDGRATGGPDPVDSAHRAAGLLAAAGVHSVVVDCESGPVRLGLAAALAHSLGGVLLRLDELAAGPLADSVRVLTGRGPVTKERGLGPPGGSGPSGSGVSPGGGVSPRASTGGSRGRLAAPGQHREVA
jgi:magnesium chelatase subunit D